MPPTSRPTEPAARQDAPTPAAIPVVLLLAVLGFVLFVPVAAAQETSGGVEAENGEVSINGGDVYAGDGCARAGNVVAGDCEGKGGDAGEPASPGTSSPEGTTPESTSHEPTTVAEETTALEATSPDTTSESTAPETTVQEGADSCPTEPSEDAVEATVARVVDGDTLALARQVDGTDQVRLIGVDAPESEGENGDPEPFAEEAAAFSTDALQGEEVLLEVGEEKSDQYGRLLAHVWTAPEDGFVGNLKRMVGMGGPELFNRAILEEGYAEALIAEPNDLHAGCFEAAEQGARDEGVGIWETGEGSSYDQYPDQTIAETTAEETGLEGNSQEETSVQEETSLQEETTVEEAPSEETTAEQYVTESTAPDEDLPEESTEETPAEYQYETEAVPGEDTGDVPDYEQCDNPTYLEGFSSDGRQTKSVEVPGESVLIAYRTEPPSDGGSGKFLLDVYGPDGDEPLEQITYEEVGTERTYVEAGSGQFTFSASAENRTYDVAVYGCGQGTGQDEPDTQYGVTEQQYESAPSSQEQAALPVTQQDSEAPVQETANAADPQVVETSETPSGSLPTQQTSAGPIPVLPETGGLAPTSLLLGASCLAAGFLSVFVLARSSLDGRQRRLHGRLEER